MLLADDAAVVSHTEEGLQNLIASYSNACKEFGLTISVKITEVMGQNTTNPPVITIGEKALEVASQFTNLGSNISSNLSLDHELDHTRLFSLDIVPEALPIRLSNSWSRDRLLEMFDPRFVN